MIKAAHVSEKGQRYREHNASYQSPCFPIVVSQEPVYVNRLPKFCGEQSPQSLKSPHPVAGR